MALLVPTRSRTRNDTTTTALCGSTADGSHDSSGEEEKVGLRDQAQDYLERARALRETLPPSPSSNSNKPTLWSPWDLPPSSSSNHDPSAVVVDECGYRLYVDLGRETGSWMDPRWGASGRRMTWTLNVRMMASSNSKQQLYYWQTAPYARLRNGFDRMKCSASDTICQEPKQSWVEKKLFRSEAARTKTSTSTTVRFVVKVMDGKTEGDVVLPPDTDLYFALPAFVGPSGGRLPRLSSKDGVVSVRQMGWHTGWFRQESRIVGTFRAVPLAEAQHRDGF